MNESGWQIGIYRRCPRCYGTAGQPGCGKVIHITMETEPTEEEERNAMIAAGIEPEELVDSGVWIAAIPEEWCRQAEQDWTSEPGKLIQECNQHVITDPLGDEWVIEVPMP